MKYAPYLLLLLGSILLIASSNYWKNVWLLTRGKVAQKSYLESVDFEWINGLIVVEAKVNQHPQALKFIFDTGAFDNKIGEEWQVPLQLQARAKKMKSDSRGNQRAIQMTLIESVQLGKVEFKNSAAGILAYPPNSISKCIAPDGLIGANLIRACHWKIDFVQQKLWMTDDFANFKKLGWHPDHALSFKHPLLSHTPKIELKVGQQTIDGILFDLGSNGGLDLPKSIYQSVQAELAPEVHLTIDNVTSGIWGSKQDTLKVAKADLTIGGR
ncbi:MAG: aspartyl protease family protein, partial [Bacteroidota bacterium]